ncbi:MAG TPA: hypothetical protein P5511_05895, partial [Candidatus Goldiibacteriota bacterium]|nr:hypothetical protein [Candidatus Goldiibacteriota bacterium]
TEVFTKASLPNTRPRVISAKIPITGIRYMSIERPPRPVDVFPFEKATQRSIKKHKIQAAAPKPAAKAAACGLARPAPLFRDTKKTAPVVQPDKKPAIK